MNNSPRKYKKGLPNRKGSPLFCVKIFETSLTNQDKYCIIIIELRKGGDGYGAVRDNRKGYRDNLECSHATGNQEKAVTLGSPSGLLSLTRVYHIRVK